MRKYIQLFAILSLLLIGFSNSHVYGQSGMDKTFGRITIGDTLAFDGNIEFPRTFPAEIRVKRPGKEFETYKAGTVTAFTFSNNQTFKAFPMEEGNESAGYFFAEELSTGSVPLYFSKKENHRFFYTEQEGIHGIDRKNYRQIINELVGSCEEFHCRHNKTIFTKNSLTFFFDRYNTGKLNTYFPMMNAGFVLQYNFTQWTLPPINLQKFENSVQSLRINHFSPGLFFHLPLYTPRRMGLDFNFTHHSITHLIHESVLDDNGYIADIKFDMSYLEADIGVRYSLVWRNFEPYFSVGLSHYQNLQQNNQMYYIDITNNTYTFDIFEDVIPQPGILMGIYFSQGVKYRLRSRTYLAADWGYKSMTNVTGSQYAVRNVHINFKLNFWPW
jgi:hypothetical protein